MDIAQRVEGLSTGEVRAAIEPLLLERVLSAVVSGETEAWRAGELRAKHSDRKTRPLSLADCFLIAHALTESAGIATTDPPLAAAARAEGVDVIALPDSSGKRPS